jgi:co-chaperonin GroES (HSP10)
MPTTVAKFRPYDSRILVRLDDKQTMLGGWLHLPEACQEQPITGTVVAVGRPLEGRHGNRAIKRVELGSRVLFGKFNGFQIHFRDEVGEFWLLDAAECIPLSGNARIKMDEVYGIVCGADDPDGVEVGKAAADKRAF